MPAAVHDGAIKPVDSFDFFELCAHRMAPVASTLKSTCYGVLGQGIQICDGEGKNVGNGAVDAYTMGCGI